jgi:hypothetical protein
MQIASPRYFGRVKAALQAQIKFNHTHSFTGAEFNTYRTPAVYVWKRGEEWLYVGSTYHGMNRLCDSKHDILSKKIVRDTDTVLMMSGLTRYYARSLEARLIREYKPKYNRHKYFAARSKYIQDSRASG